MKQSQTKLQIRNSTAEFLIFTRQAGEDGIEVRVEDETVWLTQKLIGALFEVTVPTINEHLANLYTQEEVSETATIRNFRTVQTEGGREVARNVVFYNLDAIIAVGFRVNSARAIQFRQWATGVLRDYAIRGYVLDKFNERDILDHPGKVSQEVAKAFAESEFEKYRIVQDRLFESDFDRHIKKALGGGESGATHAEARSTRRQKT